MSMDVPILFLTRKCTFGILSQDILQEMTNLRGHGDDGGQ